MRKRFRDPPVLGVVLLVLGGALSMTMAIGNYSHWIPVLAALIVGLMAVDCINK